MVTVAVVASLTELRTPWHRLWPLLTCVLLIGLPWTAGGVMMAGIVPARLNLLSGFGAVFGLVSMVFTVTGLARLALRPEEPWPKGETLVKTLYGLGLALPGLALAGYGFLIRQAPTVTGIGGLLVVVLGLGFGWWRRDRLAGAPSSNAGDATCGMAGAQRRWYAAVRRLYRATMAAVRGVGQALEGEGAFLWVLVALLAVALVLQGGSL